MRDRRLLSGAVGLSALGDFLGFIPLALYVQERTGSGIAVAGLFIALWAPSVVLGGAAGLLADRVESRRLLRDVSLGQAAVALVLALTFGGLAATLALTALLGVGRRAGAAGRVRARARGGRARRAWPRPTDASRRPATWASRSAPSSAACSRPPAARGSPCWSTPRASWPWRSRRRRCARVASRAARDRSGDTNRGPASGGGLPQAHRRGRAAPAPLAPATASPSCSTTASWRRS